MHPKVSAFMVDVLAAWILLGYFVCPLSSQAQTAAVSPYEAQAVYLYNLAKFVRWPADAQHDPVTICVAGPEAYVDALRKVAAAEGEDNQPFEVHAVEKTEQEAGCDILFLEDSTKVHTDEWLAASAGKPQLTVSDLPDFLDRGGMIQMAPAEDRMRFSVDLRPVNRCGLSLSSELLKVATSVRGAAGDGGSQ